ncbi:MAG: NAD-dependent epimerase/dehydratase family protein [Acidobacteriota bacterium]
MAADGTSTRRPTRVVVTGSEGLIGWHLRSYWHGVDDVEVVGLDRRGFASGLDDALTGADALVHLAGMNRGDEAEIEATNIELTQALIGALRSGEHRPHVVFASSTHRDRDTAYGRSKRRSAEALAEWATSSGGRCTEVVWPNVFGEHGRPFHNSAISTFCHQLAAGETPRVIQDQELDWLHAQRAAEGVDRLLREAGGAATIERVDGHRARVGEVLERLGAMAADYRSGIVPDLAEPFDRDLFNTYRSFLDPAEFPVRPTLHDDPRGRLFESVKVRSGGQCFLSTTEPGARRGGHYHRRKFERFLVVEGRARIRLRRLLHDAVTVYEVDGGSPAWVDMPTLHTHDIENIGSGPLVTLFWADEIYDPERPDTMFEPVSDPTEDPP